MTASSTPGAGSVFIFDMPAPLAPSSVRPSKDASRVVANLPSTVRILVAEDNPVNQRVAVQMLRKLGFEAEVAVNGQAAIERVARGDVDLILMDCQMPVLDGLEATRRLRAEGVRIPIIAMTANALDGDRQACLDAGMDDYISKPIVPAALTQVLSAVPMHRRPGAEAASESG